MSYSPCSRPHLMGSDFVVVVIFLKDTVHICLSERKSFAEVYLYLVSIRILAPTTYIFFASAIPVISFGEQLDRNTGITISSIFRVTMFCWYFGGHSLQMLNWISFSRWNSDRSADSCINITLWCYSFNPWRATSPHPWCSWANSSHVYLYVQFC